MNKIVFLDGAVGTSLWEKTDDRGPVWRYNIEKPEIVKELHNEYVEAGCSIILANTFAANRPNVEPFNYTVDEVVSKGVKLAKEAANNKAKVALSIGPLSSLMQPYGTLSEEEAYAFFDEQISSGVKENPDLIYLQTFMDLAMLKVAVKAAAKYEKPLMISMSFGQLVEGREARTMFGNSVKDIIDAVRDYNPVAIGLNCSLGPKDAVKIADEFVKASDIPVIVKPNAGMPISSGGVSEVDYEEFANDLLGLKDMDATIYVGGCCGSNALYIKALMEKFK